MAQAINTKTKKVTQWKIFKNNDRFNSVSSSSRQNGVISNVDRIVHPNTCIRPYQIMKDHPLVLTKTKNRISSSTSSINNTEMNQRQNIRINLGTSSTKHYNLTPYIDPPVERTFSETDITNDNNNDSKTVSSHLIESQKSRSLHLIENNPDTTRECAICLSEQSVNQFQERYSNECEHFPRTICDQCIYNNVKYLIENMFNRNIYCPEPNCISEFNFQIIRYILLKEKNFELFERYDRQLTYKHLEQNEEFVWCAHNGCGSGQFHARNIHLNPIVICIKCKRRTCAYHRTKWHFGMTCEEYDQSKRLSIDPNTQIWLKNHSKKCPKCQSYIEKISGCDHMTCKRCKHQFCWQCSADYKNIQIYGLRQHLKYCEHYPQHHSYSQRSTNCNIL